MPKCLAAAVIIDKRALEQRLGFLSLCVRKYPEKGIDHYNKLAVLRGWASAACCRRSRSSRSSYSGRG